MQMLYLRQTKNELTGEHSSIMVRALSKTSGVNDAWLDAFVSDTKRRFISLLGGPFRDMEVRSAISVFARICRNCPAKTHIKLNGSNAVEIKPLFVQKFGAVIILLHCCSVLVCLVLCRQPVYN